MLQKQKLKTIPKYSSSKDVSDQHPVAHRFDPVDFTQNTAEPVPDPEHQNTNTEKKRSLTGGSAPRPLHPAEFKQTKPHCGLRSTPWKRRYPSSLLWNKFYRFSERVHSNENSIISSLFGNRQAWQRKHGVKNILMAHLFCQKCINNISFIWDLLELIGCKNLRAQDSLLWQRHKNYWDRECHSRAIHKYAMW